MSFFSELRRRNVFKVGIAYLVACWLGLQIVDLVLENINAPDWVMQVFMLGLAVGFPIAIIVAWAFEVTPDGVKLQKHVDRSKSITGQTGHQLNRGIIVILSIAIVFLLTDKFRDELFDEPELPAVDKQLSANPGDVKAGEDASVSIAVLPFSDMSEAQDQAYFADGISEEILNVLVKTHSLKVVGRTSSFQFRGRNEDLRIIGEQLGVEHILEGSIRKAGNRVRITAQLVKASDGFHLWSETYDRQLTDIFAIQDEIARSITDALAVELNLADVEENLVLESTRNMDAYDRYLEARSLITQRLDFRRAIELLNEATQLDPQFAEGWAANAQAHTLAPYYIGFPRIDTSERAESMAKKALEINPDLSMAHSVLGDVYRDRFEWRKAQESYRRALSLNPDDIEANEQYAQMLWRASYFDEALKYSARAIDLDPLSWLNLTVHATLRYASGDRTGGWADMVRALDMSGDNREFPSRHAINMSLSEGNVGRAIDIMKALVESPDLGEKAPRIKQRYEQFIPLLNSKEDTLNFLANRQEESVSSGVFSPWALDLFWAAFYGDYALAESILASGIASDRELGILDSSWFNYPIINPLRNTKTYKDMVRQINLDDYWRENGFPINCRPVGPDDFACN